MTKAADLALGKIAALKTALIEFTDGDDAIAVADAGVVTLLTTAVAKSEGGAVTHNIAQGLAKAWSNIRYDSSAPNFTNGDSFNASSVADTAVGELTVTLSNNMANAVYACVASTQDFAVEHQSPTLTTSTYGIRTIADSSGARADVGNGTFVATIITGDLA